MKRRELTNAVTIDEYMTNLQSGDDKMSIRQIAKIVGLSNHAMFRRINRDRDTAHDGSLGLDNLRVVDIDEHKRKSGGKKKMAMVIIVKEWET